MGRGAQTLVVLVALASAAHGSAEIHRVALGHRPAPLRRRAQTSRWHRALGEGGPDSSPSSTPLFQGYGTHFAYLWVGTPAQRVSVIVDTGSGITAFPCNGCNGCGSHTDPYFNADKSSSSHELQCQTQRQDCVGADGKSSAQSCSNGKCILSQSYAEGSRWSAHQVTDMVWVGGETKTEVAAAPLAIPYTFGCQTSETGLFITQLADGIMGMMISESNLASQLQIQGKLSSRSFSLCFVLGGGVMTLGGVDTQLHIEDMRYVKNVQKGRGWYTVEVLDIFIGDERVAVAKSVYDNGSGKGMIVDSGTTDTYLPRACATKFKEAWQRATGMRFTNNALQLSRSEMLALPKIHVHLSGDGGNPPVVVDMSPIDYMEVQNDFSYIARIYLDEPQGGVLGANFMRSHDVHFDPEANRIGFAPSDCNFRPQDIDCQLSSWDNSTCVPNAECTEDMIANKEVTPGTLGRVRQIVLAPSGNGKPCADLVQEDVPCDYQCGGGGDGDGSGSGGGGGGGGGDGSTDPGDGTAPSCLGEEEHVWSTCSSACKQYRFLNASRCETEFRACFSDSCNYRGYTMKFNIVLWGLPLEYAQYDKELEDALEATVAESLSMKPGALSLLNFTPLDSCRSGLNARIEFQATKEAAIMQSTQQSSPTEEQQLAADYDKYDKLLEVLSKLGKYKFQDEVLNGTQTAIDRWSPALNVSTPGDGVVDADEKRSIRQIIVTTDEIFGVGGAEVPQETGHASNEKHGGAPLVLITIASVLLAIVAFAWGVVNRRKLRLQMEAKGRNLMARLNPSHSQYYKYTKVSTVEGDNADYENGNGVDEDIGIVLPDTWPGGEEKNRRVT